MTESKENKKSCFIITPIGTPNSEIRRHIDGINNAVIKPVLQDELGYEVSVSHEIDMPGSIPKQVILEVRNSDIVIANLTDNNPNVMYEVALRHCFGKAIIMIAKEGTIIPADITGQRTFYYINDAQGVIDLKDKLRDAVRELEIVGEIKQAGPVYDALRNAEIEEKVLADVSVEGEQDAFALVFKKLDEIQNSINQQKHEPKQSPQEKINQSCIYYINVQTKINDESKMREIANVILKKPLVMGFQRDVESIGDSYIKLKVKGQRFFAGAVMDSLIRTTFKEYGIDEVEITKEIEEIIR